MADIDKGVFAYMGSKGTITQWIIENFPSGYAKMRYVEVFGGTCRVLLDKSPSEVEIYNDFNSHLTNFFEVIRSHKEEFYQQLDQLIISEDLYNYFYKEINNSPNDIERAIRYFYIMSFCHKGKFNGGFSVIPEVSYTHKFENKKRTLDWISNRMKNVLVTNKSYEKVVTANNTSDTFLYLDPPYVNTESYYSKLAGVFSLQDHIILRDLLKKHKGSFMLSYEADPLVNDLYSEFHIIGKNKWRPGRGEEVEEILVSNFKIENTLFNNSRSHVDQLESKLF